NSNRGGLRPDRSYSLKSAVSTKRSASTSVLKVGIFLFIAGNLPAVHVAGADRPNQALAATLADRKHQKDGTPVCGLADGAKALFAFRMGFVGDDQHRALEQRLDLL